MSHHDSQPLDVTLGSATRTPGSVLRHARVGRDCRLINSVVEGTADSPVIIGDRVTLLNCVVTGSGKSQPFDFGAYQVTCDHTELAGDNHFSQSSITNAKVGKGTRGQTVFIENSEVGPDNQLRSFASIVRSKTGRGCNLGSEVSKTILAGGGFVSEHYSSYLSLVAPDRYPVTDPDGHCRLTAPLPNVSNIGAGTVFANYGGEPMAAAPLRADTPSAKGTAVVCSAFTAVNTRVINRYGPAPDFADANWLRGARDLTVLGFGCFVENKVGGRIPAFSFANAPSASSHRIGWVLNERPGIVLRLVQKMRDALGAEGTDPAALQGLIEGLLRYEIKTLRAMRAGELPGWYAASQLEQGIADFERHLESGDWVLDEQGEWAREWRFEDDRQRWLTS